MSRDYSKVLPSFWTGRTGRQIRRLSDPWTTTIAVYLITSPHANAIGLYHLPIAYVCADTGSPLEGAWKALRSLSEVGFAHYDEDTETVWVPEMARHQLGDALKPGDNRRAWVAKEAAGMEKRPFYADFLAKYADAYGLERKPLGSPLEAPSDPLRSLELEQEKELEQQPEAAKRARRPRKAPPPPPPEVESQPSSAGASLSTDSSHEKAPPAPANAEAATTLAPAPLTLLPAPPTSPGTSAMFRSLNPTPERDRAALAVLSATRQAAGGAPLVPSSHADRDAIARLGEWSEAMPAGSLERAAAAFWAAKGPGASLRWLADEDPGRWLTSRPTVAAKSRDAYRPSPPREQFADRSDWFFDATEAAK